MVKLDNFDDYEIYLAFIEVCGRYAVNRSISLSEAKLFAEQLTAMNKPVTCQTSLRKQLTIGAVDTKEHLVAAIKEYCENETEATDVTDAIYQFVTELFDVCRAVLIESHLYYNTYNKYKDYNLEPYKDNKHGK